MLFEICDSNVHSNCP